MTSETSPSSGFDAGRRRWLQRGGLTLAGALGAGSLANLLVGTQAANAADYKALVCVFLYGGNDGMNTIVPTDARHAQYAGVRGPLALPKDALLPLDGVAFGLHPALAGLAAAWRDDALAPVFNLGPLQRPLSKAQYRAAKPNDPRLPDNLFSHSDQQILWQTGGADSLARSGWGGRASEALATANPVISVDGAARFGLTEQNAPLVLPGPGSTFGAYGLQPDDLAWAPNAARKAAIDALYAQKQDLPLAAAFTAAQREAFAISARLGGIVKTVPGDAGAVPAIDGAFAAITAGGQITTGLGAQLYQVAKLIAANAVVKGHRQIFFASMGGFDTHGEQVAAGQPTRGAHAGLLKELGDALGAFHGAMKNLALDRAVTAFTQSDFGRTFAPNHSAGTDHAWGNHHLVVGGAVKGHATYGRYPELVLGGSDDVGEDDWELQGRWIPSASVDQYAATLLGWFGASDAQLDAVLPNLVNFGAARRLGFL